MLRRSTWIVLGILVALVLGVVLWQRYGKTEDQVEPTATVTIPEVVFDLSNQTITSYSILAADGANIAFELDPASNVWVVKDQPAELADSTRIETVIGNLRFITVETDLTTQPPREAMGLDQPAYMITLLLSSGEQLILFVGDLTPTGSGYYAHVGQEPAMVVSKVDVDAILNLLKTPPLAATYTPTATVTITATSTPTATKTVISSPEMTSESEETPTPTP